MNDNYEKEIDLIWLCYRVLRAWRGIVVWAVIAAVVAGLGSFAVNFRKLSDADYYAAQVSAFEEEHALWAEEGETLETELKELTERQTSNQEYKDNSVLMQIDPYKEFNASLELKVDCTSQNIDVHRSILEAYETYMTNGELGQYIADKLSYEIESRYLNELLVISVDYAKDTLSVVVKHQSPEACKEIIDIVKIALDVKAAEVGAAKGEHKLLTTGTSVYEAVDIELKEAQQFVLKEIDSVENDLTKKEGEYKKWQQQAEPQLQFTKSKVIKDAVKLLIVVGLVVGVGGAAVVAFNGLLSGKLLNPEDVKNRFGVRILGILPQGRVRRPFAFISRWISKLGGITIKPEEYDGLAKAIGKSIQAEFAGREEAKSWKKVVLAGSVSGDELQKIKDAIALEAAYSVECAPKMLTDLASIDKVSEADIVIIVEKQEKTLIADIQKEVENLKAWNKTVLGAIVFNADAVM